jgi:hypothetical protein
LVSNGPAVLHVSPHPDDEAIAAGMTLQGLARHGWRVVNLLLSTGRRADAPRRHAEAQEAARRAGYALEIATGEPLSDPAVCASVVAEALGRHQPGLVVSPQPHDGHPAHEAAGRAVRQVLEGIHDPPVWWMWGLWADLAVPTLYVPFGAVDLARSVEILSAYSGELARNDYRRLVRGRATSSAVLGSERVFGFGSAAAARRPYAELLTEAIRRDGRWWSGARRVADLGSPLVELAASEEVLDGWISDPPR